MRFDLFEAMLACGVTRAMRFHGPFVAAMEEFGIRTGAQQCCFLAQVRHESLGLLNLEENLNYHWRRLREVWPKRFLSDAMAQQYHRQPEKIANLVYARRMGNGGPETGDGWKYRGRGPIQLTGRTNYTRLSAALGEDLVTRPDRIKDEAGICARSAAWFWDDIDGNRYADCGDIDGLSRRINGGAHGLDERAALTEQLRKLVA